MGTNERTKEQFLEDYSDIFYGDDKNGYVAKDQFISDIDTYTNHSASTLDELREVLKEGDDDELAELHNSIMANLFGDGDNYQGSFETECSAGNGDYDWYLYFGEIIINDDYDGFIYRNVVFAKD